jgi:hypothetical protein
MGQGAAFYIYAYIANFRNLHNSMMSKILPRPAPLPQTHGDLVEITKLLFKLVVCILQNFGVDRCDTMPHGHAVTLSYNGLGA